MRAIKSVSGYVHDERGQEALGELLALGNDACYFLCNVTDMKDLENVPDTKQYS